MNHIASTSPTFGSTEPRKGPTRAMSTTRSRRITYGRTREIHALARQASRKLGHPSCNDSEWYWKLSNLCVHWLSLFWSFLEIHCLVAHLVMVKASKGRGLHHPRRPVPNVEGARRAHTEAEEQPGCQLQGLVTRTAWERTMLPRFERSETCRASTVGDNDSRYRWSIV